MRLPKALAAAVASGLALGACASPYGPEYAYDYPSGYYPSRYGYYQPAYYGPGYGYYGGPRYSYGGYGSAGPHMTITASF